VNAVPIPLHELLYEIHLFPENSLSSQPGRLIVRKRNACAPLDVRFVSKADPQMRFNRR
jgi:hypothetical protein